MKSVSRVSHNQKLACMCQEEAVVTADGRNTGTSQELLEERKEAGKQAKLSIGNLPTVPLGWLVIHSDNSNAYL